MKELNRTCRAMQTRIVQLLDQVGSEEVTEELLRVNDDLNNVFIRYDRYERNRAGALPALGTTLPALGTTLPALGTTQDQTRPQPSPEPPQVWNSQRLIQRGFYGGAWVPSTVKRLPGKSVQLSFSAPGNVEFSAVIKPAKVGQV